MSPYIGYDSDTTFIPGTLNTSSSLTIQGGGITQTGGDVNFDSGTLFIDEDLNRVGIGITTPIRALDVYSNDSTDIVTFSNDSGTSITLGTYAGMSTWDVPASTGFRIRSGGSSGQYLTISSTGNVGIGTTNPLTKLHVFGDWAAGQGILKIDTTGNFTGFTAHKSGSTKFAFYNDNSSALTTIESADALRFFVSSAERLRITSDGNVGIGTTNPSQKLTIWGGDVLIDGSGTATLTVGSGSYAGTHSVNVIGGGVSINNGYALAGSLRLYNNTSTSSNTYIAPAAGADIVFTNSAGGGELVRIENAGNVGIGTTNPGVKLDVNGPVRSTKFRGVISTSGDGQDNAPFQLEEDYSSYMVATAAGAVSQPAGNLPTWGLFWAGNQGAAYGTNGLGGPGNIWNNSTNPNEFVFVGTNSTRWSLYGNTGDTWQSGSAIVSGNVGIGITSPNTRLHIHTGGTAPLTSSGTGGSGIIISGQDGIIDLLSRDDNTTIATSIGMGRYNQTTGALINKWGIVTWYNTGAQGSNTSNRLSFHYGTNTSPWGSSELVSISSNGNVGIGTTNPATKLHIANGGLVVNANDSYQVSSVRTLLVRGGRARNTSISNEENAIKIWPGEARVTTVGAYWGGISFNHLEPHTWPTYTGSHLWIGGRFPQQGFPGQEYSDLVFATNNSATQGTHAIERMCITYQGNVGIGVTNPSDKLVIYNANVGNPTGLTIRNTEATSAYSHARLRLESQNATAYAEIWADVANSGLRMGYNGSSTVRIDSTGNVHVPSGAGIGFGATADAPGATSELFDDYEEGTWTPVLSRTSTNPTVTYSTNRQKGRYTKIGNVVTIWFDVDWTSLTGGSGDPVLGGLPYNVVAGTSQAGYGIPSFRDASGVSVDFRIYGNSSYFSSPSYIFLRHYNSSGVEQPTTFNSSGRLTGWAQYFTNNAY